MEQVEARHVGARSTGSRFRFYWIVVVLATSLVGAPALAQKGAAPDSAPESGPESAPETATDDAPADPPAVQATADLRAAINLVPAEAVPGVLSSDIPFTYADVQGVLVAASRDPSIAFEILMGQTRPAVLQRLAAGFQAFSAMYLDPEQAVEAMGFSWRQTGAMLEIGTPPETLRVLGGSGPADTAAIAAALGQRGFALETLAGTQVWHRQEDMQINIRERDPTDPFWGEIGSASRIAMMDGFLVGARSWDPVRAAILGTGEGILATPPFDAAVDALDHVLGDDGRLVQAIGFAPGAVADEDTLGWLADATANQTANEDGVAALPAPGPPRFSAALLADAFSGIEDITLLALVYEDAALADEAAALLPDAFARTASLRLRDSLAEVLTRSYEALAIDAHVVPVGEGAVVVLRIAGPAFSGDEFTRYSNHGFRVLVASLFARDLGFLTRLNAP